jgi:stage II sporulation protein D
MLMRAFPLRDAGGVRVLVALAGVALAVAAAAAPQRRPAPSMRADTVPVVDAPAAVRVGILGPRGTYVVRSVPIEEYVAGVLTGEAAKDSQPAVLQALAIAIRTFALKNLNRHAEEGFDVCDQTHCQVLRAASAATEDAAAGTAGEVLTWQGGLAIVYYSASCGGRTEVPSKVWPGAEDPPYLPSRRDEGCEGEPAWTAQVSTQDLGRALNASGFRGSLKSVRILSRDESGRVDRLGVDGLTPSSLSGQDLRMFVGPQLGWQLIKSTAFELRRSGNGYQLTGNGYGHGVGMCVIGATKLAARGESAEALLARYFPGTAVGTIRSRPAAPPRSAPVPTAAASAAPASVAAPLVPDAGAEARRELDLLASRARTELSALLQVAQPAPIAIRVHSSDEAFERATGRHWFTFGALVGGELHLMPLDQLRQRGVLERIVRREIVHALLDAQLQGRPRWVRDGAALYFADPEAPESELRAPCPTDVELAQPVSAGALSQAHAQARACFARQVAAGRSWREVR